LISSCTAKTCILVYHITKLVVVKGSKWIRRSCEKAYTEIGMQTRTTKEVSIFVDRPPFLKLIRDEFHLHFWNTSFETYFETFVDLLAVNSEPLENKFNNDCWLGFLLDRCTRLTKRYSESRMFLLWAPLQMVEILISSCDQKEMIMKLLILKHCRGSNLYLSYKTF